MKYRLILISFAILTLFHCGVEAQVTSRSAETSIVNQQMSTAKDLYRRGMYVAAERVLDALEQSVTDKSSLMYSEIMANKMLCAIALGREDMEGLARNFHDEFPNNPRGEMVKYYLAEALFDSGDYNQALRLFDLIDERELYKSVTEELFFKYGYCNLQSGDYDGAIGKFETVTSGELGEYTYPAYYYLGFAHYVKKDFATACTFFEKARKNSKFTAPSDYYEMECKFMLKDYDYVLLNGNKVYETLNPELQNNLSRIISESYYAKGNIAEADKFFDKYISSGVTLSQKDRYYAGILAYSLGEYAKAVDAFADVRGSGGVLGQSASYYSANSYLLLKNKVSAMQAFMEASSSNADPVIREDALFNFAKLSFDVNGDISQFENYVRQYPSSGKSDVINSYMSVAFLSNKDYASAINVIEKIKHPSGQVLANLQKAQTLRAAQLMNNGGYSSAMSLLHDAMSNDSNHDISSQAKFLYVECLYRNERFHEAVKEGRELSNDRRFQATNEYQQLKYNLGYAYFKLEDFQNAAQWFERYLSSNNLKNIQNKDASLRLADVYFMQGKYTESAEEYQKVVSRYRDGDLYPYYQSAIAYGLNGENEKKISVLEGATSTNHDDKLYTSAVYELGRTYVQTGNNVRARSCFEKLLSLHDSTYHAKSLLELAMLSSNREQYAEAIGFYDRIVRAFPYSTEAQDALIGMESIYQMQNRPSEYLAYLDRVGMSDIKTAGEKEMMVFTAAEQIYYGENHSAAVKALQSFIEKYPDSPKLAQAYFYLGETFRAMQKNETAAEAYFKSMEAEEGDYSEAATANYADIIFSLGQYEKACEAYETLVQIARSSENRIKGHIGMMLSHFGERQYLKSLQDAESISKMDNTPEDARRQADFIAAKSYMVLGQRDDAREIFKNLAQNTLDDIGAEAAYILIQDLYDSGDFVNVENRVYAFSDSGTSQLYWLAKSFIVLGDSFADREEWKQARATFESIRDGYAPVDANDDVPGQVEIRLNKLKTMGK